MRRQYVTAIRSTALAMTLPMTLAMALGMALPMALGGSGCGDAPSVPDSGQPPASNWNPQPKPTADAGAIAPPLPATLSGQVTLLGSSSNAGVGVTIVDGNTTVQTLTDANGSYLADDLAAGDLVVTFAAPGYRSQTRSATAAAGDSLQISASLEHSRQLESFAEPVPAGASLGYAQWIALNDGGQAPGTRLYYFDSSRLRSVDADAGARELLADDGGLHFLGFDREGAAVLERITPLGTEIDFALTSLEQPLWLGPGVFRTQLIGDEVYFARSLASSGSGQPNENEWGAITAGDLGATPIAQSISDYSPAVPLADGMAGWELGADGYTTPVAFGPGSSVPIDSICTQQLPPLTASLDGQRYGFAVVPRSTSGIQVAPTPPGPDACPISKVPTAFIVEVQTGDAAQVTQIEDATLATSHAALYPLSDTSYAGTSVNADRTWHLFVHQAKKAGAAGASDAGAAWTSQWESDIAGWSPLHGPNFLAADRADGGLLLEAIGPGTVTGTLRATASLPFAHEWSAPLAISDDNRYVVLQGIAALFDLEKQVEIPLIVTPVRVQFDRAEKTALLLDPSGQMAVLWLGGPAGAGPQGVRLEGSAVAASFTPAEDAVAYAGTDAFGESGIFVQPIGRAAGGTQ